MEMPAPVLALVRGQALPAFLLCSTLLVIKMYVVAIITGQVRLRKKVCSPGAPPPRFPGPSPAGKLQGWETWPRCSQGQNVRALETFGMAGPAPSCPLL